MEGTEVAFIFWNKNGYDINFKATCIAVGASIYTGSENGEILVWVPSEN